MHGRQHHVLTAPPIAGHPVLRAGRRQGLAAIGQGLAAPCRGFVYMAGRPALWRYGLLPILLNLLISLALLVALLLGVRALSDRVHASFADAWWGTLLAWASLAALALAAVAAVVAAWFLLQRILCDFFYLRLARRVELDLGADPRELCEVDFLYDLLDTLASLALLVAVNLGLLLLHCVPVVGSLLAAAGSLYVSLWVFGLTFMRYPLLLRGWRRRHRGAFARAHQGQTLGVGAVVFACNLLPVVNAVLLTGAVVGAVLLHRELAPVLRESARVLR
jgi:uncharacterized protein involved in cysteine biosynthesis